MKLLTTKYLGLTLDSPIIVSSSPYTSTVEGIVEAEKAGAGAVVLKSIFEEQILAEVAHADQYSDYPEAADYLRGYITENSLGNYLQLIQQAKAQVKIPIIASVNCSLSGDWAHFARVIETAGADALELNIFFLPTSKDLSGLELETQYLAAIARVRDAVEIPVSVKLPQTFTNPLNIVKEIYYRNINGVVLFNRFYTPDIDVDRLTALSAAPWSHPEELHNILRWTALIASEIPLVNIATSTGVRTGRDAVKAMLAGATAVQLCTAIHENGLAVINEINRDIELWMRENLYNYTTDFIGKLSYKNIPDANAYERTQFMKYFSSQKD